VSEKITKLKSGVNFGCLSDFFDLTGGGADTRHLHSFILAPAHQFAYQYAAGHKLPSA
jgi:hypothetical protein